VGETISQDRIITGPKLVTPSNAKDMLAQEEWTLGNFLDYSRGFSMITGRQVAQSHAATSMLKIPTRAFDVDVNLENAISLLQ